MTTGTSTLQEVDDVLRALAAIETAAEPELAVIPGLSAIVPFLGIFRAAASGVDIVAKAEGVGFDSAKAVVIDHNLPGQPNATALGPTASPP